MPEAGVTHDAVLDGLGLLIVPNTLRKQDIVNFSPQVRTTEPRYNDFALTQHWVCKSWHHGRGAREWGDPYTFDDSTDVDTAVRDQVTLGPLQLLTTKAAAASLAGNPVCFRLFAAAANLYCATGGASRDVFSWDNSGGVWTAETAGLSADPTDMAEFLGVVYVAQGEAYVMRKETAGTWADAGVPANLVLTFGSQVLYRADNINEIYYTVDGTNWSGPIYVGDTNTSIRALAVGDGKLYIGKDDGLYFLQDKQAYQLLDFQFARDSNNFKNMKWWQGALYFPILDGLYRLAGSTLQAIGPDLGAAGVAESSSFIRTAQDLYTFKGIPSAKTGRIVDIAVTDNWLFAAIDGVSGTSQIVKFNGAGWHQVLAGAASNTRIRALFCTGRLATTGQFNSPRIWYGYGTDAYNVITPFGTEDPYDYTLQTYASTGQLVSPWFSAGLDNVFKEWNYIQLYSEGLTANETVQVAYELDDLGVYQNMVNTAGSAYAFTFSPYQTLFFPKNTIAKKIRFRFTLARGGTTTLTPKIRSVVTGFMVRPNTLYSWQVVTRCGRDMSNPYTRQVEKTEPSEWVQYLEQLRDRKARVVWDDGMGEPAITNLVLNAAFRVDSNSDGLADNWTKVSTPTTTLDITHKQHGLRSQKVVTGTGSTQGVQSDNMTTVVGTRYTASAYLWLESGDRIALQIEDSGAGVIATQLHSTIESGEGFTRVEVTAVAVGTSTSIRVVRLTGDATAATTFYVSAVQFEVTPDKRNALFLRKASSYCDGDQPRCRWTGRAYVSTATRAAGYLVAVTNINRVEVQKPNIGDLIFGRKAETRVTFSVAETSSV